MSGEATAPSDHRPDELQEQTSPIRFPPELPISARVRDIAEAIDAHPVVIVAGATGSGKTTQLPKIALAMGRGVHKMVGVTQPRRIAATSVAARVASELGSPARHRGRLSGALRRPHVARHVREVHDRRDPPRGDPRRSAAPALRHDHHRRGARAEPHDRFSLGLAEAHPTRAAGPQSHRELGDARNRAASRRSSAGRRSSRSKAAPTRWTSSTSPRPTTRTSPRPSPTPSRTSRRSTRTATSSSSCPANERFARPRTSSPDGASSTRSYNPSTRASPRPISKESSRAFPSGASSSRRTSPRRR